MAVLTLGNSWPTSVPMFHVGHPKASEVWSLLQRRKHGSHLSYSKVPRTRKEMARWFPSKVDGDTNVGQDSVRMLPLFLEECVVESLIHPKGQCGNSCDLRSVFPPHRVKGIRPCGTHKRLSKFFRYGIKICSDGSYVR